MLMIKKTQYIGDVVKRFNQQNAKSVENPCASDMMLSKLRSPTTKEECAEMKSRPYRSLIGCLMYITTCTRPDIAFVVTQLSRFLENPGTQHWKAAIRVLRYLNRLVSTALCTTEVRERLLPRRSRTRTGEVILMIDVPYLESWY